MKNNKLIISLMVVVFALVSATIFVLNYSFSDTSFSVIEKKWITDNSATMLDISTFNDIPVFGKNGNGIIFDFLDEVSNNYDISFNRVSYYTYNSDTEFKTISFRVVPGNYILGSNDIHIYNDYFALVSKDKKVFTDVDNINNLRIGVIESDIDRVKYYLGEESNTYVSYKDIDSALIEFDREDKVIDYLIVPINQYIDTIVSKDLFISYKMLGLYNQYILSCKDNTLYSILNKSYTLYKSKNFDKDFGNDIKKIYFDSLDVSVSEQMNYNSKTYYMGYVIDAPFTISDDNVDGIIVKYLDRFSNLFDIDIKYNKYSDNKSLIDDINNGSIDFAFSSFNTDNVDIEKVNIESVPYSRNYVILSSKFYNIDSIRGLYNYDNVNYVSDSFYGYILDSYGVKGKSYKDSDKLLINTNDDAIVVVDKFTYLYYSDSKFKNYNVLYDGYIDDYYSFSVFDDVSNNSFSGLISIYSMLEDFNSVANSYVKDVNKISIDDLKNISKYLLILFIIIFIFLLVCLIFVNKKNKDKLIKRDDKFKYIDLMTSLKNRNYLNHNMKKWTNNRVYPKAVIIVDLNNVKYINDNYGYEEGDNEIKKAANILIVNQLPNSDIMRIDGNEFLIYLLGYDEKHVVSYCHKLFKELKGLPRGFGASVGYSMVIDDVKTIEDAINEATIEMRKAKEKGK